MTAAVLVKWRHLLAGAGIVAVAVNSSLNALAPSDIAEDQLVWMFAIAPMVVVGAVLLVRAPASRIGLLMVAIAAVGSSGSWQAFATLNGWLSGFGAGLSTLAIGCIALLLLLFPDGSLPSPRWRWAAALMIGEATLGGINGLLVGGWGGDAEQVYHFSPLYESTRSFTEVSINVFFPLYLGTMVIALASLLVRYRRGAPDVRHQLKWLMVGVAFMGASLLTFIAGGDISLSAMQKLALAAGMASVPIAIGIAVLRYRLYDIDIVISRSLTYGILAAFIGVVYIGIVVGIGELLGQGDRASFELSIAATAVVAMAFQPVRRWVQRVANRLVFGERATPYEVLAHFSRRAAEASDDQLLERVPRLIVDGTGASAAALWVRSGEGFRVASAWPESGAGRRMDGAADEFSDPSADFSLPISHRGELLGGISLVKARGETITPSEEELIENLVGGMGLALRNARLTARLRRQVEELERSRDRVVSAADEARRSLEHDLDSGPQQQMVALKVKLGPIRKMAEQTGAEKTAGLLTQLEVDAGEAIKGIREFAGGVYPPLLEAEGLTVALRHQVRAAALPVEVEAVGVGRYSREVEAAVYFTVLEALQNITKYAHATSAVLTLRVHEDTLEFEVADDGIGFDVATAKRGAGLSNMADRLDSVGGTCDIRSEVGSGTTVSGAIPAENRLVSA